MRPQYPILDYFTYDHLPESLQAISKPFCELAHAIIVDHTAASDEITAALRKLLEAKDCVVRASVNSVHRD